VVDHDAHRLRRRPDHDRQAGRGVAIRLHRDLCAIEPYLGRPADLRPARPGTGTRGRLGAIRIGPTVEMAYVDQSRDSLDDKRTVWQEISDGMELIQIGKRSVPSRAYVAAFNFKGADQQKPVGVLSGGERNRVHLAKMLKSGGNVLLLDEPTNDLDVDTLRALESGLESFPGCAVVISHDRWFLDRIATHVLAFEGDSQVRWFEGNFSDYEAWKRKELGASADQPRRIKYKPLTRK
jgi:ATPase subunit of ABC transporter with duplicated ATPase domains